MFHVKFDDGPSKRMAMVWEEPAPSGSPSADSRAIDARASEVLFKVLDRARSKLAAQSNNAAGNAV